MWLTIAIAALIAIALAARWLFRQRTPAEMMAARDRLRRMRGKSEPE